MCDSDILLFVLCECLKWQKKLLFNGDVTLSDLRI